jgi:hypothetical protein
VLFGWTAICVIAYFLVTRSSRRRPPTTSDPRRADEGSSGPIVDEIAGASIGSGGGGTNAFEDVLYSQEVVRASGYSPDLVVVSPADALAIQLLVMSGGDSYAFSQQLPSFVVTPAVADGAGFVADSSALGTLFLGPFTFAVFEEANGTTNSSTVRAESSGRFVVQRSDAAATLSSS